MEIKDRIKIIMDRENMIAGSFADSIGMQQSTLSHVINGRNRPSLDVVMKIHQRYTYINLEWLLYGTGEMISGNPNDNSTQEVVSSLGKSNPSPKYAEDFPSLFDQNPENTTIESGDSKDRKENALEMHLNDTKPAVVQEVKYIERPHRKITEIRIFFDDNTYETFKGEK